ncbi:MULTISPECIES: hypothetical protein [Vreelandella]|uniref:hypothetical protein n=1 Tax=Vreelandella TaxID=3137766 RepID=UPI0030EB3194|tara:strand:- start:17009 stop:17215 length:207 start_codon:yes stop_codon:yes gene_type:complete
MTLSIIQRNCLRSQGIEIKDELPNGSVLCVTDKGERIYTAQNLEQIAVPRLLDRFAAFMSKGVRHAAH